MLPFHGCFPTSTGFLPEPCLVNIMDAAAAGESILSCSSRSQKKSKQASCNSHKEAERRRRQRINAHLSTLRSLLPNTTKTDKASLLAEVVHHLKELRKQTAHVTLQDGGDCGELKGYWQFPGESDEVTVSHCEGEANSKAIRVSVCCEDRPGLNEELSQAIRLARGRAVRAEMMTVGGRTRSVVVVEWGGGEEEVGVLRRAVKAVVENRVSSCVMEQVVLGNKRLRSYSLVNGTED